MGWGWKRKGGRQPGPRSALDMAGGLPLTSSVCAANTILHPSFLVDLAELVQSRRVQVGFNPAASRTAGKSEEIYSQAHLMLLIKRPEIQYKAVAYITQSPLM